MKMKNKNYYGKDTKRFDENVKDVMRKERMDNQATKIIQRM